jgi:N-acetylmuramoyl-L-alanine amidase
MHAGRPRPCAPGAGLTVVNAPSPNHGPRRGGARATVLLLHHTGMGSARGALARLRCPDSGVSAHYLVGRCGRVWRMVDEGRRAWHAGAAHWAGTHDVNSASVGVEVDNPGAAPYRPAQVRALVALCRGICARHPIRWVLAHGDVAPHRKADPGPHFPWAALAAAGVGAWPATRPPPPHMDARAALLRLGYDPALPTPVLLRAFQRHWAPPATGRADARTRAALAALLAALARMV